MGRTSSRLAQRQRPLGLTELPRSNSTMSQCRLLSETDVTAAEEERRASLRTRKTPSTSRLRYTTSSDVTEEEPESFSRSSSAPPTESRNQSWGAFASSLWTGSMGPSSSPRKRQRMGDRSRISRHLQPHFRADESSSESN